MKRILVADDDPTLRQWLAGILRAEKFEVSTTSDGSAALKKLRTMKFDLVALLDGLDAGG